MGVPAVAVTEELVFQQAVEGLFVVGLRGMISPVLKNKLKAGGLDLSRKLDGN